MAEFAKRATTDCPFSFWTDIDSQAVFSISAPSTIRSCLGGMEGSMLDTYGGEYEWDFFTARLHRNRGNDYGVRIVYGKNLVDFQMEKSIENVITGVHPYWKNSEDGALMELPEKVVMASGRSMSFDKVTPLDCSSQFQEKPTEEQLRSYAVSYLKDTSLTDPDIDIKIDFLQLWQTPGYADIAAAERVSLCDTVHVYIAKLGIEVSCKVTETEYNVLLERYTSITLSNASVYSRNSSLSGALGSIRDEAVLAAEAVGRVESQVADTRTLSEKLESLSVLAAGLFGIHHSSGMTEDGIPVQYAHTSEKLVDSQLAWMGGPNGFFVSTDGGKTWGHGWDNQGKAIKLAVEAVGLHAEAIVEGTLRTALVKILGTEYFTWQGDAILMSDPGNPKRILKIGQYEVGSYGIAASEDGGETWVKAIGFEGIPWEDAPREDPPAIQGEIIVKAETPPENPDPDSLWIDKSVSPLLLKLWDGMQWQVVGYTPPETGEPTDPEDSDNADVEGGNAP